jgi:ribosome maturation factor RimP
MALHLSKPFRGENLIEGELLEATPENLTLRVRDKSRYKEIVLLRADVDKANLAIKF